MAAPHVLIVPAWWPSPENPFAGAFVVDYARAYAAAGVRVGVIFPDILGLRSFRRGPIFPRITDESVDDVPVVRIRMVYSSFGRPRAYMARFACWLERGMAHYAAAHGRPDVVHAHCAIPAGWAALELPAPLCGRVVITEHTGPFSLALNPPAAGALTRAALARAGRVAAVSDALREQMRAAGIERPIEVIPNPVGAEFAYAPPPPTADALRLVFVGRITREKGIFELADTARRPDSQHLHWDIVGDGPDLPALRRAMPPERVTFHGACERRRIAEIITAAHALVLPSYGESFGLALAEALACGRPVITTTGTGCEQIVGPGDGELCRPRDSADLAAAVARFVAGYSRYNHSDIARRAAARFAGAATVQRYLELFAETGR